MGGVKEAERVGALELEVEDGMVVEARTKDGGVNLEEVVDGLTLLNQGGGMSEREVALECGGGQRWLIKLGGGSRGGNGKR
ncbi:hypothetical protein COCNU_10G002300 [Cocos nucifera]|uniref:Uncharacterized protein n=1 Tax=Cocos nucifera TaxID=13894 RepID=A0A8K0ILF8_COCNU|nr:hypothetical protein COCNU_10G002300 [Cocos nucifera]